MRVDTFLSAGVKLMINVRQETRDGKSRYVPYISYSHSSFNDTENSVRVAWPRNFDASNDAPLPGSLPGDLLSGDWEVMTIPTNNVPSTAEVISNGVPSSQTGWVEPSAGNVADGLTKGTTNLANSVFVGYLTREYFEGAILKTADIKQ
jgi:hypothetical protein